jgi:16S rRNA (cytidine1402-2'-O)-methyltransferase
MTEAEGERGAAGAPGAGPQGGQPLDPGLYLVATPIGAARDVTLRALDVLAAADDLVAEDTRTLRRLMEIHGIPLRGRRVTSYHDHNGTARRPRLLAALAEGRSVAYCSDAGTPLVADPGFRLAREAAEAGHAVHAVPGASALLAALSVAGLPTDRFLFAGFPPPQAGPRGRWIAEIASVPATLVIYETGRRIGALAAELAAAGHGARDAALCRELTKLHEEVRRAPLADLAETLAGAEPPRGELVLVVGPPVQAAPSEAEVEAELRAALAEMPLKRAAARVAERTGMGKRDVYQLGLRIKGDDR